MMTDDWVKVGVKIFWGRIENTNSSKMDSNEKFIIEILRGIKMKPFIRRSHTNEMNTNGYKWFDCFDGLVLQEKSML